MRQIIITCNFHPNELVAYQMAHKVHTLLGQYEHNSLLIDLQEGQRVHWAHTMARDPNTRWKLLKNVLGRYQDAIVFDFHDSDILDLTENGLFRYPVILKDDPNYHCVECPAVYVRQEDIQINGYGKEFGGKMERYFTERSDWQKTQEAGLCTIQDVIDLTDKIASLSS